LLQGRGFYLSLGFSFFAYLSDPLSDYEFRHVFQDGLKNQIETRHSVSFCLFFCPIGILTHVITKAITKPATKEGHGV